MTTVILLGLVAPAGASPSDGLRDAPGDALRIVAVDTSRFPEVVATIALPLRVRNGTDRSGAITVASAGEPVAATITRIPNAQRTLAILVDAADDTDPATLVAEQGAVADLLIELDPTTPVVLANSVEGVLTGPSTDRTEALAALGGMRARGTRNWPAALERTIDAANPRVTTIVVVSAGPSTQPASRDLPAKLQRSEQAPTWISLRDDARPTGALAGIATIVSDPSNLLVRLDSIAADLAAQYRVRFRIDARATAADFTLVVDDTTWTVETPLPLPVPAFVIPATAPPATSPPVTSVTIAGPDSQPTTHISTLRSVATRTNRFVGANWGFLGFGLAAIILLGIALAVASPPRATRPPRSSRP